MAKDPANKKIYGLIGYPVKHSLSPAMQNAAFAANNINAEYLLFEVSPEGLEEFLLKKVFLEDILGLNITIPHKVKAREILEKNFPSCKGEQVLEDSYYVKLSGAVNTVKKEGNELKYFNTDASGFLRSLKEDLKFDTTNKNALVIGCGGAGRSIIAALSWKNINIKKVYVNDFEDKTMVSARKHFSQDYLKDRLKLISTEEIPEVIRDCSLLVNATPIGMKGEEVSPVRKDLLHKGLYVYDIVYNRTKETLLVRDTKSLGLPVADGLKMLLRQGANAFELWTGQKAPVEVMREALQEELRRCRI
jgi:shikimate dehydrogenase